MVEHLFSNEVVEGSSPSCGSIALSFNGRTPGSDPGNLGSSPGGVAVTGDRYVVVRFSKILS